MRWLLRLALALAWCLVAYKAPAPDFKMTDGSVITGELVAPNDDGTVIRRSSGGLTSRLGWDKFSQETLQKMAEDPKLKELVEAFIDPPAGELEAARPEVVIKDPPGKVQRPERRPGLFAALNTPAGWFILGVLLLANLYAAYEVSVYRNYPAAAVIGTSVVLPVLGPILFLCMPTRVREDVVLESQFEAPQEVASTGKQELAAAGLSGGSLSLSAHKKETAGGSQGPAVYKRGEVEFNRSFFERTFPQFFRLTRGDTDMVLAVRSAKGEVVATRISRISSNEIGLMTQQGHEVQLRFGEMSEVQLRPKA